MPKTHLKKFYQEQELGQDHDEQNNKLRVKNEQNSFSAGKNLLLI